jgi:Bacterial regulatory proteins, tetR family
VEAEAARGGRVARNRQRRSDEFQRAGLRIVTEEGFEALTMSRLADELDTAVGSVYHYFPSKSTWSRPSRRGRSSGWPPASTAASGR